MICIINIASLARNTGYCGDSHLIANIVSLPQPLMMIGSSFVFTQTCRTLAVLRVCSEGVNFANSLRRPIVGGGGNVLGISDGNISTHFIVREGEQVYCEYDTNELVVGEVIHLQLK